jgi:diaminopimelate epimerase
MMNNNLTVMNINFRKYQGTGNDFVILDNRNGQYNGLTVSQISFLCNRRIGIGADGLMLLEKAEGYDFRMVYHNADGHEGSMCGNGGRCLVKFAHDMGISKSDYQFIAVDGPHEAKIDNNRLIHLKMKDVSDMLNNGGDRILNTGSPHYIRFVDNLEKLDVYREGKKIRYNDTYAAEGINVNFVARTPYGINIRTYERGVEDETLSCGTGATAAAIASSTAMGIQEIAVGVVGGQLSIQFNRTAETTADNIWLIGPAQFVFEGNIII